MQRPIRSLYSKSFAIEVLDHQKTYFVLIRLSDGQHSPLYTLPLSYECFKMSYDIDHSIFNKLCELELNH